MLRLATLVFGGMLVAASVGTAAETPARVFRIGILATTSAAAGAPMLDAFRKGLRELGYVEGQNVVFEYRWAEGKADRFPRLAADLARLNVDVVVTRGTPAALAAQRAMPTTPIVMASSADPVGLGLVQGLARPGGNVTGLTALSVDLSGKRIELLKEALPQVSRVGILWNPSNPSTRQIFEQTKAAAQRLGLTLESLVVQKPEDVERAFDEAQRTRVQGLVGSVDAAIQQRAARIAELATRSRLPAVFGSREFAEAGALISYGVHFPDLYRRAATYVDRIFKGAKPADLPVEQPTKFELVINLKTAKALGLTIPQSLLLRADQVIQ